MSEVLVLRQGLFWRHATLVFLMSLPLWLAAQLSFVAAQSEEDRANESKPATLIVSVTDRSENPIAQAHVELRVWTSDWVKTDFVGESDAEGKIEFTGVKPDEYSTILVTHPDFASSMQDFTITAGEERLTQCTLLPSVESSIEIRSPDGELLKGAEVSRLEVSSPGAASKTFLSCDMFPMLTGKPKSEFRSDESGRLKLPPLPVGSSAKITVVHPTWSSADTAEIELTAGMLTTLVLNKGTNVTMNFHGEDDVLAMLKGQEVSVHTFVNNGSGASKRSRLIHKFVSTGNTLKFCLPPGQYDAFYLTTDDLVITPQLPSSGPSTISSFNNFDAENVEKNCVVRKSREIRGRVITSAGEPVVGATLIVSTENLVADSDGDFVALKEFGWHFCDYPVTNEEGYYTAKVPDGKVQINSQFSSYYSDPAEFEFVSDGEKAVPDFVVHPFPTLKGVVLDEAGKPCPSAVIRVLSFGESKYVVTDQDGKFSSQIKSFDYDQETKKRKFESNLLAFDPQSDQAELVTVGVKDPVEFENIEIKLKSREPNWIAGVLSEKSKERAIEFTDEMLETMEKARAESVEKFHEGVPGNRAPELLGGTWFNTDAKSLEDFRGQYVLLDFWFIGCGPCERDFPNLKLAQELYGDQGFTVLSVHTSSQTPENVKQYSDARGLEYPLVVDSPSEEILNAYKEAGVRGFPSYILVGPDGKILFNDQVASADGKVNLSLRAQKLEAIHQALRTKKD